MRTVDTKRMFDLWEHNREIYDENQRPTIKVFEDVDVVAGWALPLKNGRPVIAPHDGAGWSEEHIQGVAEAFDSSKISSLSSLNVPVGKALVLLSFPGAYTFGHWPLDVCARIQKALDLFQREALCFLAPGPLPSFAHFFLDAYGVNSDDIVEIDNYKKVFASRLIVPLLRPSAYFPSYPYNEVFSRLKKHAANYEFEEKKYGDKIYVKHVPQTSVGQRPTLSNSNEIEKKLKDFGFKVICPAEMSLSEQISAFRGSTIIVGEDSSALHNIIYSEKVHLFVLESPLRRNVLHMSLCQRLGHTCHYLGGQTTSSDFEIEIADLMGLLEPVF